MNDPLLEQAFSPARAEIYDEQFVALRAVKDLMHLILRVRWAGLPEDARVLVAGAGTGAEVRFLAPLFPRWRFTLVDPARGMLAVAERHARAEGFAERCAFHCGYVSSLPEGRHDAATSILVSHFLTDAEARRGYFEEIAARLKPGAYLFDADLCADREAAGFEPAMDLWLEMLEQSRRSPGAPSFVPTGAERGSAAGAEAPPSFREMFGERIAVHGPAEVEAMMRQAGFEAVTPCFQAVLIRGWMARRR